MNIAGEHLSGARRSPGGYHRIPRDSEINADYSQASSSHQNVRRAERTPLGIDEINRLQPKVIFIGAGPVGLWTAIQMKLRRPELSVGMIEKRSIYTRTHSVRVKKKYLKECAQDPCRVFDSLHRDIERTDVIPIRVLEERLKKLAEKLGIIIQIKENGISNIEREVILPNPELRLLIGTDGSNSIVNSQLFGENNVRKDELSHAALVQYQVLGRLNKLKTIREYYPALKATNHKLVKELIGKYDESSGTTPVTLHIQVSKSTYESLRDDYRKPVPLGENTADILPKKLLEDIGIFIGMRICDHGVEIAPKPIQLNVTATPQKHTLVAIKRKLRHHEVLLGDAAMGLSFYQGLNAGIKSGTKFAEVVAKQWTTIEKERGQNLVQSTIHPFEEYDSWFRSLVNKKINHGLSKRMSLMTIKAALSVANILPLQIAKISKIKRNEYIAEFNQLHSREIPSRNDAPKAAAATLRQDAGPDKDEQHLVSYLSEVREYSEAARLVFSKKDHELLFSNALENLERMKEYKPSDDVRTDVKQSKLFAKTSELFISDARRFIEDARNAHEQEQAFNDKVEAIREKGRIKKRSNIRKGHSPITALRGELETMVHSIGRSWHSEGLEITQNHIVTDSIPDERIQQYAVDVLDAEEIVRHKSILKSEADLVTRTGSCRLGQMRDSLDRLRQLDAHALAERLDKKYVVPAVAVAKTSAREALSAIRTTRMLQTNNAGQLTSVDDRILGNSRTERVVSDLMRRIDGIGEFDRSLGNELRLEVNLLQGQVA